MRRVYQLALLAALLLLGGCEERPSEYYVLWITTRVVDTEGNPIQGIWIHPEGYDFPGREGYTDYKGEMGGSTSIKPTRQINIVFEDVDGEHNGGEYESHTCTLKLNPVAPDEYGFSGSDFIKLGDIVLNRK